jgi:hypothetical protein
VAKEANGERATDPGTTMPLVPESLGVDPMLLALVHVASLLDFAEDDVVDPEAANVALEYVEEYLQRLPAERLDAIQADLDRMEEYGAEHGWSEEMTDFVRDFLYNCGLDDDDEAPDDEGPPDGEGPADDEA